MEGSIRFLVVEPAQWLMYNACSGSLPANLLGEIHIKNSLVH